MLAWAYLLGGVGIEPMPGMAPGWPLTFLMWATMMVGMMLPSAAPAILLYARLHRHSDEAPPPTTAFLLGYVTCWTVVSGLAATLHWGIEGDVIADHRLAGALLIAVGIYQLSPLKDACLSRCRSPAQFISRHYRPGALGAARLGLLHGAYCVGCCWLLMGLLFVGGVMNLAWIAALTLLVAAEKLLPHGEWIARAAGMAMIAWGGLKLAGF